MYNVVRTRSTQKLPIVEAERRGYESFFAVHDQALGLSNHGSLEDYMDALCKRPKWFPDFPLDADGKLATSYEKS